jgi:DNA polymerase-3 subunit gamma/tau
VKFIFATTEANKIPITILSRCQRFDFAGIDMSAIQTRLTQIATAEGVEIEPEAVQILASRAAGSMRDSQSLLEQLLSVADKRITGNEVHAMLGTAPVERLNGLVNHLVARNGAAAMSELDAAISGGVEVGQLLDQLIGYFRDVMAAAVGCSPQQMIYTLPSQASTVAEISRTLGLQTVLAIVQILDQTAARLRVSLHGRTLLEMAIVRICQLDDLDDLAAIVAELREPKTAGAPQPVELAKKKVESQPLPGLIGAIPPLPTSDFNATQPARTIENGPPGNEGLTSSEESVLKRFQMAVEAAKSGTDEPQLATPRLSRRQQAVEIGKRPFVERALDLFEVAPGQFRYSPPEGDMD